MIIAVNFFQVYEKNNFQHALILKGFFKKRLFRSDTSYFGSEGDAIDKAWTSKLEAKIDESSNTIQLQAPSAFMRDWINSNYLSMIERASRENNVKLKTIT